MDVVSHKELALRVKRPPIKIDPAVIPTIKSLNQAVAKCAELVVSIDKTVAIDTGIDASTWARIKQGDAGIKGDFLDRLMDACGNELPLFWLLHSRGYDPSCLRRYETDVEKENRELREQLERERAELAVIKNFIKEMKAA